MSFTNIISRSDVGPLIPEETSNILLEGLTAQSAALSLFRTIPMSSQQVRMPVLSALPTAYWVTGDTGLKQTTEMSWENKYMNVEELAAIVPIPENVANDLQFDVWDQVQPLLIDAIIRALDAAIFLGTNKPNSWPDAIVPGAIAAGHAVDRPANAEDMPDKLSDLFSLVEDDGYAVDFALANPSYRGRLRKTGLTQQLNPNAGLNVGPNEIFGITPMFPMPGLWPTASDSAEVIVGSRREAIVGIRQDFTWKLLTEAVIQDNTGAIIFNLPQQDMVALRVVFRAAFQVANTIKYENTNPATRYPFAVMQVP
jgi:HK97 family phage major capsid protein